MIRKTSKEFGSHDEDRSHVFRYSRFVEQKLSGDTPLMSRQSLDWACLLDAIDRPLMPRPLMNVYRSLQRTTALATLITDLQDTLLWNPPCDAARPGQYSSAAR
jgi:hypothetical protein